MNPKKRVENELARQKTTAKWRSKKEGGLEGSGWRQVERVRVGREGGLVSW